MLFFLSSPYSFSKESHQFPSQYVVKLKSKSVAPRVIEKIKSANIQILARGDEFLVIRPESSSQDQTYKKLLMDLKTDKNVLSVDMDKVVYPREMSESEMETCSGPDNPLMRFLSKSLKDECLLNEHCQGRNPQWAKYFIDADLADKEVAKILKQTNSQDYATVAVVDSGFNHEHNVNNLSAQKVRVAKGFETAGSEFKDESGHGTAVSGMIAAKEVGVTSHVNLNIYRTTEGGGTGSTSNAFLAASIEKACRESDIVNVSWGSDFDEIGFTKIEDELWYKKAKELGCLVVKSSGNGGIKKKAFDHKVPEDAPVILVGAINNNGLEATFSTVGDIKAPGEGVYTLVSQDAKTYDYKKKQQCQINGVTYGPINGTSFSSPSSAAVAGQIVTVLKARKVLPQDPIQKVKLIKNILKASALGSPENVVNAYRAVKMASVIENTSKAPQPEEIEKEFKRSTEPLCKVNTSCLPSEKCEDIKGCTNRLRESLSLCQNPLDRKNLIMNLFKMNEKDLITGHLSLLSPGDIPPEELDKMLEALWEHNTKDGQIVSVQTAINLIKLADKLGRKNFIGQKKFKEIFASRDYSSDFDVFNDIGESVWNQGQEQLYPSFMSAFSKLEQKDQLELIDYLKKQKNYNKGVKSETLSFLLIAKKYPDLLSEETNKSIQQSIKNYSDEFFDGTMISNLRDYELSQTPVFDLLVLASPDGKEKIKNKFSGDYSENNIKFITYALNSDKVLSKDEKTAYSLQILRDYKGKEVEFTPALQAAIDHLIDLEDLSHVEKIKQILLSNPYLGKFYDFKLQFSFQDNVKKKLLQDAEFWKQYASFSVQNAKKFVTGDLDDKSSSGKSIEIVGSLIETRAINDEQKIKILQEMKPLLKSAVELSQETIDKAFDKYTEKVYESKEIIEEISDNYKFLKDNKIFTDEEFKLMKEFVNKNKNVFYFSRLMFED